MSKQAMKRTNVRFNYEDYLLLPEDKRYEILDGDLYVVPAPGIKHQNVSIRLSAILLRELADKGFGTVLEAPCDVILSQEDIVQPDILFIRKERLGIVGELNIQGPPDLIVEILTPNTREKDLKAKQKVYARFGIQEYWIVDPDGETVEVLVWSEVGYISAGTYGKTARLSSSLLPNLRLPLSKVFKK